MCEPDVKYPVQTIHILFCMGLEVEDSEFYFYKL